MKITKSMIFPLFILFIVLILVMSSLFNHLPEMNFNYNVNNEFTIFQNSGGNINRLKIISNFTSTNSDDQLKSAFKKNEILSQNIKYIYYVTRDFYKRFGTKKLYYNKNYFKERKYFSDGLGTKNPGTGQIQVMVFRVQGGPFLSLVQAV